MAKEAKTAPPVTERSLFYWVFRRNLKLQLILLVIIILVVFARVVPLEMQKRIINDSIALKNIDGLMIYCGIYLFAITAASALKLAINYLQAIIGERAMNRMRKSLYQHILTLPLGFFRTTQPGMVVSALMTELSTAGTFAGEAFAVPVTNILTLLALGAGAALTTGFSNVILGYHAADAATGAYQNIAIGEDDEDSILDQKPEEAKRLEEACVFEF